MMGAVLIPLAAAPVPTDTLNRTVLPIPEPKNKPITILDARNAKAHPRFQVKAPEGAPNVLVILIDDQGFGVSSAFGGPVK
jgi:arylsulfatase